MLFVTPRAIYWNKYCTGYQLHVVFLFSVVQQPLVGQGFLIIEALQSHSEAQYSTGLLWTSDQPVAETFT
jgi:hypothetical protein